MYTFLSLALFCTLAAAFPTNASSSGTPGGLSKRQNPCGPNSIAFNAGRVIEVVSFNTGASYGFLAPNPAGLIGGTGYGVIVPNESDALQDFVACNDPRNGGVTSITASNVVQTEPGPFIGLASVFGDGPSPDMTPGSPNWLIFAPTIKIADGAEPDPNYEVFSSQVWFESGVWSYNCSPSSIDCEISARWVNSKNSSIAMPNTFFAAAPAAGGIAVTGDYNAFFATWGGTGDWSQARLIARAVV